MLDPHATSELSQRPSVGSILPEGESLPPAFEEVFADFSSAIKEVWRPNDQVRSRSHLPRLPRLFRQETLLLAVLLTVVESDREWILTTNSLFPPPTQLSVLVRKQRMELGLGGGGLRHRKHSSVWGGTSSLPPPSFAPFLPPNTPSSQVTVAKVPPPVPTPKKPKMRKNGSTTSMSGRIVDR
jgi:hypothetical protein